MATCCFTDDESQRLEPRRGLGTKRSCYGNEPVEEIDLGVRHVANTRRFSSPVLTRRKSHTQTTQPRGYTWLMQSSNPNEAAKRLRRTQSTQDGKVKEDVYRRENPLCRCPRASFLSTFEYKLSLGLNYQCIGKHYSPPDWYATVYIQCKNIPYCRYRKGL